MSRLLAALVAASTVVVALAGSANAADDAVFRTQLPSPIFFSGQPPDPEEEAEQPAPLSAAPSQVLPPTSQIGGFFTTDLAATGGTPPYHFDLAEPHPVGWVLSGTSLSGMFTSLGDLAFSVVVKDSATPPLEKAVSFATNVADSAPLVVGGMPGGIFAVGASVSAALTATGNDGAATFSLNAGTLPSGLALSPAGLISGVVAGAVGQTGSATIRVTDSYSYTDVALAWAIALPSADTTIPVEIRIKSGSSWLTAPYYPLNDGNLVQVGVGVLYPNVFAVDLGKSVTGNSFLVAANKTTTYRIVTGTNGTSYSSWGAQRTVAAGAVDSFTMPDTRTDRYVGIQVLSPTSEVVGFTEFRYGLNGAFP